MIGALLRAGDGYTRQYVRSGDRKRAAMGAEVRDRQDWLCPLGFSRMPATWEL
jgi:hypothetical protein